MKKLLIIFISVFLCSTVWAGMVGNTSMNIGTSARVAGMGYSFTGIADDGSAMEFNPAGLYRINDYYFSFMHLNLGPDVVYEYANAVLDTKFGTFGLGMSLIHLGEEEDGGGTGFDYFDFITSAAYSKELFNDFSAGTTVRFFNSKIGEYSANTIIFDLGILYGFHFLNLTGLNVPNLYLGACIKNIGPGLKYAEESESLPLVQRFGMGYKISDTMTIASDLVKEGEFPIKYGFGIENITGKVLNLRLGYSGGESKTSFGGGVGVLIKISKFLATVDFTYLVENGSDSTTYLTLSFQKTPPSMEKFGFKTDVIFKDRVTTVTQEKVVEKEKIVEKPVEKVTVVTQEKIKEKLVEKVTVITQEKIKEKPVEKITVVTQEKIKEKPIEKTTVITQMVEGKSVITVVTQKQVTVITQRQIIEVGKKPGSIVVVVLNFENTGNSKNWEFLSKTIGDSVSSTIADHDFLTVMNRLMLEEVIEKSEIKPDEIYKLDNLKIIGKKLNANVIVKGSFIEINKRLQITTEVFDLESGTVFASSKVLGRVGANMFDLMDKTADTIVKDLKKYMGK